VTERTLGVRWFPASDLRFIIILKNACSTVQATVMQREGIDVSSLALDELHQRARTFNSLDHGRGRSLVVLRDPLRRFVSATLHGLVVGAREAAVQSFKFHRAMALALPNAPRDADGSLVVKHLTFADIARAVRLMPDWSIEEHFRSQDFFLAGRRADHTVWMEAPDWRETLAGVIGPLVEFRPHATSTRSLPVGSMPNAAEATIAELRRMCTEDGVLPAADDLLTPDVTAVLERRYAADLRLVEPYR